MIKPTIIESVYAGEERRGSMSGPKSKTKALRKYVVVKDITIPAGTVVYQQIKDPLDEKPFHGTVYSAILSTGEFVINENELDEFKSDVLAKLRE